MNHELKTWIDATLRARDEAAAAEEARKAEQKRLDRERNTRFGLEILAKWQVPVAITTSCTEGYLIVCGCHLIPLTQNKHFDPNKEYCYGVNVYDPNFPSNTVYCQSAEDFAAWLRDRLQYEADEAAFADG